ncbi:type II toxin-antitoxin system HipA family toxin [Rhizorhabdus wittichii]|uniref:type II toxin-antitoxin system HipA family toxin n=1 Tax=Rhizorhabdus wittichii TaxID=160791 RepID=UPI00037CAB96|nr:type II toxin-antitoxin system HipA family toxin [Rhizorhabdus wittichii]
MAVRLPIYYGDRLIATVFADGNTIQLRYDKEWCIARDRFPISLSMPIADEPYGADILVPWLMNLLPEGEPLRAMTRALGAASDDILGLIAATGTDLAGALSIGKWDTGEAPAYRQIPDDDALERIITELPSRPFLVNEDGVSMSLAGAQDKLPVAIEDGRLAIPINGAPSTHILKPDNPRLLGSVQNEALCMVLARRAGLDVAAVTTGLAGARSYLLVTRYDRADDGAQVRRLHQEDFCQALGRAPGAKYEFNGSGTRGPSLADMFALVRQHMTARDINRLLDAVIFNVAIGNVDSHVKNYSAMLAPNGFALAPLYDLMSGLEWAGITQNHAQAVGEQRRGRHIYGRHWRRMAEACGLNGRATIQRIEKVTSRLLEELPAAVEEVSAMPAGPGTMLDIFQRAIRDRAQEVRAHAAEEGGPDGDAEATALMNEPSVDATAYKG